MNASKMVPTFLKSATPPFRIHFINIIITSKIDVSWNFCTLSVAKFSYCKIRIPKKNKIAEYVLQLEGLREPRVVARKKQHESKREFRWL
jgi:hypothetical protein